MEFELEPIEGERVLSAEEKERQKYRTRSIRPEELERFNAVQQQAIREFLVKLIILTEQFQHDLDQHDASEPCQQHMQKLNAKRQALFEQPPSWLRDFIELVDLYPMEPWAEFEILLRRLQAEDRNRFYETKAHTGIKVAADNPFLMQQDDDINDLQPLQGAHTRLTPADIEAEIMPYSLPELVKHLTLARRVSNGGFWDEEYYDL